MEIHIQEIDTFKYLDRYLNNKPHRTKEDDIVDWENRYIEDIKRVDEDSRITNKEKEETKELIKKMHDSIIKSVNNTTYWRPPTDEEKIIMQRIIDREIERKKEHLDHLLETTPLDRKTVLKDEIERLFNGDFQKLKDIHYNVINGCVVQNFYEVARYIGVVRFAQYVDSECQSEETNTTREEKPLKWIGKIAHLGYIMGKLAEMGYIDTSQKRNGEINYNEFARQLSKVFNIDSIGNLAKELNPEKNSMGNDNKDKIQIPHIKIIS